MVLKTRENIFINRKKLNLRIISKTITIKCIFDCTRPAPRIYGCRFFEVFNKIAFLSKMSLVLDNLIHKTALKLYKKSINVIM